MKLVETTTNALLAMKNNKGIVQLVLKTYFTKLKVKKGITFDINKANHLIYHVEKIG